MSNSAGAQSNGRSNKSRFAALTLAALGVVYGDIGTSPLYAFKEAFSPAHGLAPTPENIFGVLSMIFWAMVLVICLKYVFFILRADNHGEGGSLALMALLSNTLGKASKTRAFYVAAGLFATALFFGDGAITPAISVLSAVEGLKVVTPAFGPYVVPISCVILVALFMIQKRGTGDVGKVFGPMMVFWFLTLAVLGVFNIVANPHVFEALNPVWIWRYFQHHGPMGALILGAVILALTGVEALYADLGHFGRGPIVAGWAFLVMPSLVINYLGQGALALSRPETLANPFFNMAPSWATLPLVGLSAAATVVASQALISGVFSMTKQGIALGYLPRMEISHTNTFEIGQIYIPAANRVLLISVIALVLIFKSSDNLSSAYGLAVNGTMVIDTLLAGAVFRYCWGWSRRKALFFIAGFLALDLCFLGANLFKLLDGGWMPLAMGAALFLVMTTWKKGREILRARLEQGALSLSALLDTLRLDMPHRVSGASVFMHSGAEGVPPALLHNLRHNQVLHETTIVLTVNTAEKPYVSEGDRLRCQFLGDGVWRAHLSFGFRERPDVPRALRRCCPKRGLRLEMESVSYFFNRETLVARREVSLASEGGPSMAFWREKLFVTLAKNAGQASDHFHVPAHQVVELGARVEI